MKFKIIIFIHSNFPFEIILTDLSNFRPVKCVYERLKKVCFSYLYMLISKICLNNPNIDLRIYFWILRYYWVLKRWVSTSFKICGRNLSEPWILSFIRRRTCQTTHNYLIRVFCPLAIKNNTFWTDISCAIKCICCKNYSSNIKR